MGLAASSTYNFYATTEDVAGNLSSASNTLSVTTLNTALTYCTSSGNAVKEYINGVKIEQLIIYLATIMVMVTSLVYLQVLQLVLQQQL